MYCVWNGRAFKQRLTKDGISVGDAKSFKGSMAFIGLSRIMNRLID